MSESNISAFSDDQPTPFDEKREELQDNEQPPTEDVEGEEADPGDDPENAPDAPNPEQAEG